jgi:CBS domain containing-hemolysin-like protein
MTPRGDIVALPDTATADEVLAVIEESGHSRLPVYCETLDRVVGVLHARDLFRYVGKHLNGHDSHEAGRETRRFELLELVRRPLVVPETKKLSDLLRDMQLQKLHMAIVLDEYNGTSGLITIEDIIEQLVGEIADEHENEEQALFTRVSDTIFEADARLDIEELNRLVGLGLPEDAGFDTLGGFVMTQLGRIPAAGTSFPFERDGRRAVFEVLDAERQRVNRVRIDLEPADAEQASASAADSTSLSTG